MDSINDHLVKIFVMVWTSEIGNTTIVVITEVSGTSGAHGSNKVVSFLGSEVSGKKQVLIINFVAINAEFGRSTDYIFMWSKKQRGCAKLYINDKRICVILFDFFQNIMKNMNNFKEDKKIEKKHCPWNNYNLTFFHKSHTRWMSMSKDGKIFLFLK